MPIFRGPESGKDFDTKFVRLRSDIFIGDGLNDSHMDIALKNNILDESDRVRIRASIQVDAGLVKLNWDKMKISVGGKSTPLQLPIHRVREEARSYTIVDFRKKSPGFEVAEMEKEEVDAYYK